MQSDRPVIRIENARYTYPGGSSPALDGVTLSVDEGEFLAVLGRNGSGKSTLARVMNALILPDEGTVCVNGITPTDEDLAYAVRRECGMVFQNPDNQIVATIVEEDCAFGPENLGIDSEEIVRRVRASLSLVGMLDYARSAPHMLSGGQKQRIAVAGVLAMQPRIIVFDESTAMLDPIGRQDVFDVAQRLNRREGLTVVWITHFMNEAARADRICVMDQGKIAMEGAPREVFRRVDEIEAMGLECPEMTRLAAMLRARGVDVPDDILTAEEMEVALCRSK